MCSWPPFTHLSRRPPEKVPVCLGLVLCRSPVAPTEALVDRVVAVGVGLVKRGGNARVCGLAGVVQLDSALAQAVRFSVALARHPTHTYELRQGRTQRPQRPALVWEVDVPRPERRRRGWKAGLCNASGFAELHALYAVVPDCSASRRPTSALFPGSGAHSHISHTRLFRSSMSPKNCLCAPSSNSCLRERAKSRCLAGPSSMCRTWSRTGRIAATCECGDRHSVSRRALSLF